MAQSLKFLSAFNGFIPEATGQVIAFVRQESEFALNKYVQYVPAPKPVFEFAKLETDEWVRVESDEEFAWEDGDERPRGDAYKIRFTTTEGKCYRRDYPSTLGYRAIDNTVLWKPRPAHMAMNITKAMTNRTKRTKTLLQTTSNWPSSNVADVNVLNGGRGKWPLGSDDPSSPNYLAIYRSLIAAARRIHLLTNGRVRIKDLQTVVSPNLAIAMAQTPEMLQYVRETPQAINILKEGFSDSEEMWTLPERYKGFKFVVEDAPIVDSNPTDAPTIWTGEATFDVNPGRHYIWDDATAVMVSRPGGLDGEYGAPSFSTVQLYHFDGLLRVKAFDDSEHERVKMHVEEDVGYVLAAGLAGFCMTNAM